MAKGTARCTLKDVASAPALERAIAAEIRRQAALLDRGVAVTSLTLAHDAAEDRLRVLDQHSPEADCCYLPEPDLPPLRIDAAWLERVRATLSGPQSPVTSDQHFG